MRSCWSVGVVLVAMALLAVVHATGHAAEDRDEGSAAALVNRRLLLVKSDGKVLHLKLNTDGTFDDLDHPDGNPNPETWRIVAGELTLSWNAAYALYSIPDCIIMAYGEVASGEAHNVVGKHWTYTLQVEAPGSVRAL